MKSKQNLKRLYFGAPAATMALEALIAAGGRSFVVIGGAGSINPRLRIGDVLIPTWGVREECTSYHYAPPDHMPKPSTRLANMLYEELKKLKGMRKFRVVKGGIWSIDAFSGKPWIRLRSTVRWESTV